MTSLLFLAIIVLAVLLVDTRKRMRALESTMGAVPTQIPYESHEEAVVQAEAAGASREPDLLARNVSERARSPIDDTALVVREVQTPASFERQDTPSLCPAPEEPDMQEEAAGGFNFEELFGRKLPIWAGGITLVVAAVFLVRYSIDSGLLSPVVRIVLGSLLGFALIGGAELARRREDFLRDERVAQALSGAGIATLYAVTLAAANLYGMIGSGGAFGALAAITAGAGALALRFGAPSGVLALLGGLAAPALIQSQQPNIPLLAVYIALLCGGIMMLSRSQRWMGLGIAALLGGGGWSFAMILAGALDGASTLAVGSLVLVLGMAMPIFTPLAARVDRALIRLISASLAALQLALLVATGGFSLLTWGLYGLLSLGFLWMCRTMPSLRALTLLPLCTALALLLFWPEPWPAAFAGVLMGLIAIYASHALWRLQKSGALGDALAVTALALVGYGAIEWHFQPGNGHAALLAFALAVLPGAGATIVWLQARDPLSKENALLIMTCALLVDIAMLCLAPEWASVLVHATIACTLVALGWLSGNRWLSYQAGLFQLAGVAALALTGHVSTEFTRLIAIEPQPDILQTLVRWYAVTISGTALSWSLVSQRIGIVAQVGTALLAYGLAAQIVPAPWLSICTASAALIASMAMNRPAELILKPAFWTWLSLSAIWGVDPIAHWIAATMVSLTGKAVLLPTLPDLSSALRWLLSPAVLSLFAIAPSGRVPQAPAHRLALLGAAGCLLAGVHVLYKHLFAISDSGQFIARGLAERSLWEALLLATGLLAWKVTRRPLPATIAMAAGGVHALIYSIGLHNPLWADQSVGPWPIANLVTCAFALPLCAILLLERLLPSLQNLSERLKTQLCRGLDCLRMPLLVLLAYASVRQIFIGSLFAWVPLGPVENIVWSLLAVGLAISFLVWGLRKSARDWRLASLILMLGAAAKVFLLDAAGLEGLLRIGSFLALGFSLIAIGWLYSRFLKPGM